MSHPLWELVLVERPSFDLDSDAVEACAAIMLDAEKFAPRALLVAAGNLLPVLLRSRDRPVSPIVVALFPSVHRELAKFDEIPDLLKFIPFFDWDRCKAVRHELVDAFMSSCWPPSDLAMIACRAGEVSRILRRIDNLHGGRIYIERLASELHKLPESCKITVENELSRRQNVRFSRHE